VKLISIFVKTKKKSNFYNKQNITLYVILILIISISNLPRFTKTNYFITTLITTEIILHETESIFFIGFLEFLYYKYT